MSNIKRPIAERENLVCAYVNGKLSKERTAELLGCTTKTVGNYANAYLKHGALGLIDHRHSNNFKLSLDQKKKIIELKNKESWRSARNIRDYLKLSVHKLKLNIPTRCGRQILWEGLIFQKQEQVT